MIRIERYRAEWAEEWNAFVRESKNGTFLFDRGYMDYHSDRFCDHSLVFTDEDGHWLAVLPANERDGVLHSHQGLTYGGLLMSRAATIDKVMEMFQLILEYAKAHSLNRIIYKATPWIYHTMAAEEDLYALTQVCHANLLYREISTTVFQQNKPALTKSRKCGLARARKANITVTESEDYATFWQLLTENLASCHDTAPVHSLDEMLLLRSRFPRNIRLYAAMLDGEMLGGCVIYEYGQTIHSQYIASSPHGKQLGALDLLLSHVINNVYADSTYFDFGKSTEDHGYYLNHNLIHQKQGFGGRGVCYDTYEIRID